jgi:type IX secretion system PorP/SprF family membrane protein
MINIMKLINRFFLIIVAIICVSNLHAQQLPQYTQYIYNTMSLNSGYTGTKDLLEAYLLHRSQWVGFEGAPKTQAFGVHSPISDRVGIGLNGFHDAIGPSDDTNIELSFSYKVKLSREINLSFGLNSGISLFSVDWSKGIFNQIDPLFNNNINNRIRPTLGSGIYAYSSKWYAGISVPNFLNYEFYDDMQEKISNREFHMFFIGGYVFDLSTEIQFKPAFMFKYVNATPLSVDLSGNFLFSERVTLGVNYRYSDSFSGLLGLQLNPSFFLGYSYDRTISGLQKYNDGSHEIILRYHLFKNGANLKSPRFF